MNAATRAVIERLVEALEQYAPRDRAVMQDLIAEARKLLEGDALAQPADEDAWQREMFSLINELHSAGLDGSRGRCRDAVLALNENVRTRPQQAGFVSVPVEPTSMRGLSITSSDEDGAWLRFDLPGGASAAISVLLLAEKFNEKSIVSQVLKEWSAMSAKANEGAEK